MQNYYFGHLKNRNELYSVSSGGLCTALARYVVNNGGVVYGKKYAPDFRSIHNVRIVDITDIDSLKGSKYIFCREALPIDDIANDLRMNRRVLFFGLPCEVAAINKAMKMKCGDVANLVTVDLICHGPTDPLIACDFLDRLEKKYGSKVVEMTTRYKKEAWTPTYLFVRFENGKTYVRPFYESEYGIGFTHYIRSQCYQCKFKGVNHVADLTAGDAWGVPETHEAFDARGTSVVVARNEKADRMLHELDDFQIWETNEEEALSHNPRYYTPPSRTQKAIRFEHDFQRAGLHEACMNTLGVKAKIRYYLPQPLVVLLRKVKGIRKR